MNYRITTLTLKRGAEIVCNILSETEDSYTIRVFDVKNCKLNFWKNGDECTIYKCLIK